MRIAAALTLPLLLLAASTCAQERDEPPGEVTNSLGMRFRLVRPGSFVMGAAPRDGEAAGDELPAHRVTITEAFYLGATEVTQEQYERVMGANPSRFRGADLPVEQVSWLDAEEFCFRLSLLTGEDYRLPTEAQWEYAARAGSPTVYSWSDSPADAGAHAWFSGNSAERSHPVATRRPNAWGLHDTAGNVWEWCADCYGPYDAGPQTDPAGPPAGAQRVSRGGAWFNAPPHLRASNRNPGSADLRHDGLGFRVVLCRGAISR